MRTSVRTCFALSIASAALAACSSTSVQPKSCGSDADCPSGAFCVLAACVADALPVARISADDLLSSNRDVVFDGSGSKDPDPGDGIASFAWAVTRGPSASCDASPSNAKTATLRTIFPCHGEYQVELRVTDMHGGQSAPARLHVSVSQSLDPPVITDIGAPVTYAHRCSGTPLVCEPYDTTANATPIVSLRALASDAQDGDRLSYQWSYSPPDGVDPASAAVVFEPDANTRTPIVHISTNGTRISGDWTFRVRVTDGDGLVTPAEQVVTIKDEPPVIALSSPDLNVNHRYVAPTYFAVGVVQASITDPDGDPIDPPALQLDESIPTHCTFRVIAPTSFSAGALSQTFEIQCGDPGELIGATKRTLRLQARDPNGAVADASIPLTIFNRQPQFEWRGPGDGASSQTLTVPHRVEPCASTSCYVADGESPVVAVDPDGDPLAPVELRANGLTNFTAFTAAFPYFALRAATIAPDDFRWYTGKSRVSVTASTRDPWTSSDDLDARSTFHLSILNTAPAAVPIPNVVMAHRYSDVDRMYYAEADVAQVADPDGDDPFSVATSSSLCYRATAAGRRAHLTCMLPFDWRLAPPSLTSFTGRHDATITTRDAWDTSAPVTASFTVANSPPVVPGGSRHVEACDCTSRDADGFLIFTNGRDGSFDPRVTDSDGDPVHLKATAVSGGTTGGDVTGLGGGLVAVSAAVAGGTMTVRIDADDGMLSAWGTYTLELSCSQRGEQCGGQICTVNCK